MVRAGHQQPADPALVRSLLAFHLVVAAVTALAWIALVVRSWRARRSALPGSFSRAHRRWGWAVVAGVAALSSTGCALYALLFVA
jgi:hypothetical protein